MHRFEYVFINTVKLIEIGGGLLNGWKFYFKAATYSNLFNLVWQRSNCKPDKFAVSGNFSYDIDDTMGDKKRFDQRRSPNDFKWLEKDVIVLI